MSKNQMFQTNPTSTTGKYNRFDHEQAIMNCWNIVDDIRAYSKYADDQPTTKGEIEDYIASLANVYEVKFQVLMKHFENSIK